MESYILGIDTSCYTTSVAIVDFKRNLIVDKRIKLEVLANQIGLRQSEAFFQHVKNLPIIFDGISKVIKESQIKKITYSSAPRNVEGSYMPVFMAGSSFGKSLASILNIPREEYSHQEGHIEAAKWSAKVNPQNGLITVHISGGTTEILETKKTKSGYKTKLIGGTLDISAGQLIDRIGVSMGLGFPAGKELEELSKGGNINSIKLPISVKNTYINFSGAETYIKRILNDMKYEDIAIALLQYVYKSLVQAIYNSCKETKLNNVLLVGGVASNQLIRDNLYMDLKKKGIDIFFGSIECCTDNAIGTALLGTY